MTEPDPSLERLTVRRDLPSGTVTFLLTDIEGSTALWDTYPDAMSRTLDRHDQLVMTLVAAHGGQTIKERGEGDATLSVFARATDAVRAAVAIQLAIGEESWTDGLELRTRIALHTGEAQLREGDYYGGTVNRAARIRGLASGGQVLCSRATHDLVVDVLPADVDAVELGTRDLKGLRRDETVYALSHPQLAPVSVFAPGPGEAADVFVGRSRELAELRRTLDAAVAGRGTVVLISGEPGIGKTSLAGQVGKLASERNARVLWGRCVEGEGGPAYWPVLQVLRAQVEQTLRPVLRAELGSDVSQLARLLPELRELVPDSDDSNPDDEGARFRLFDAVYRFIGRVASKQPLVLVFDDLHAADRSTLLLLEFAARLLPSVRVLVVGTYRNVDVDADHPLLVTLGEFARVPGALSIELTGLEDREIATFVAHLTDSEPEEQLVEALAARTDGNPFFVGELLRLLAVDGRIDPSAIERRLPETVRAAVARRLARVDRDARDLLAIAAVIGRDFDDVTLEFAAHRDPTEIRDTLDAAVTAYLVRQTGHNSHRFVHALVRDTLLDQLSTARRADIHGRIADALEHRYASELDSHLDELALHTFAAARPGQANRARSYSVRAARGAESQFAHETAADHYERVLALSELEPVQPLSERLDLLLELGAVAWRSGDRERARDSFRRAADLSRSLGDGERFAQAAIGFAEGQWFRPSGGESPDRESIALLEEAAERVGTNASSSRALVLACLAKETIFSKPLAERQVLIHQAVDMARHLGDLPTLGSVLGHAWAASWTPDNLDERVAIADELTAIAHQTENDELASSAAMVQVTVHLECGNADRFNELLNEEVSLAERLRIPAALVLARTHQTTCHIARGEFAKAERTAEEAIEIGTRIQYALAANAFRGALAMLGYHRGQLNELLPLLAEAAERSRFLGFPVTQALFLAHAGREREARAIVDRLVADPGLDQWPRTNLWLLEVTSIAEAISLVGPETLVERCYEMLLPFANRQISVAFAMITHGSLAYILGRLARQLGRLDDAAAHYLAAIKQDTQFGFRPHVARSQAALAELLAERGRPGDRDKAATLLEASRPVANELGMRLVLAECDQVDTILSTNADSVS